MLMYVVVFCVGVHISVSAAGAVAGHSSQCVSRGRTVGLSSLSLRGSQQQWSAISRTFRHPAASQPGVTTTQCHQHWKHVVFNSNNRKQQKNGASSTQPTTTRALNDLHTERGREDTC